MEVQHSLTPQLSETIRKLYQTVEEDWVEDNRFYSKNLNETARLVEQTNEVLAEMGEHVPAQYKGRQFLVYGTQLKLLPLDRIEGAKQLAATFT